MTERLRNPRAEPKGEGKTPPPMGGLLGRARVAIGYGGAQEAGPSE